MLESFIKFGFSAGVLDPKLHGRGDLKNYDLGLAEGRNFCVDFLGGVFTRPGTEFVDYIHGEVSPILIPFQFNNDLANTYMIVIAEGFTTNTEARFIQDGAYVLEAAQAITVLGSTITVPGHGYQNDRSWVKILGQTYIVKNRTTDTFTLETPMGEVVDLTGSGATEVARILAVPLFYDPADLPLLKYSQDGDVIYLNHPNYMEQKLTRVSATSWLRSDTSYSGYSATVSSITTSPSTAGTAGAVFAVTPVNKAGEEGLLAPASLTAEQLSVDYTATAGHMRVRWSRTTDAVYYNIYRGLVVPVGTEAHFGMDLGFLGSSKASVFTDRNIVPDFTKAPLERDNPFAQGAILTVNVGAGGSGYNPLTTSVSVSGGVGSGFSGVPIVEAGVVRGVRILNPGEYYTTPLTVTISGGGGTGATATATASPMTGTFPACGGKVQQRRVRGGTNNDPLTLFGSRVGRPDSYSTSGFGRADDPYILTLDAETQTPIRHIVPATEGMFVFCDDGVFLVRGIDDAALTATTAKAMPQTSDGSSHIRPIQIDREVLYVTTEFESAQAIGPSNLPTYFTTTDRSVLASHYFGADNPILNWCWSKAPHRLLWVARADGTFLSCSYLANQEVFAWSDHTTKGEVKALASVRENGFDRVYAAVLRNNRHFIERLTLQEPETEEDMWAVDCGVRSALTFPAATITVSGLSGTVTVTADSGIFGAGDVGRAFRAGGGRGEVTSHLSSTQLTVQLDIPIRQPIPEITSRRFAFGSWSLTPKFSSFSGLDHLEGETVEILADGAEVETAVVTNGSITLVEPASYVLAGLGFTGRLKTLPPSVSGSVLENREKNVKGLAVRLLKARGLRFGDGTGDVTYPMPTRTTETYGVAPRFKSGLHSISIRSGYDLDGSIVIDKIGPHSASILGLITETDIEGG